MKYKKIMILAFCLFLFVGNVFSQQINFDSFKRDDVNAFDRLIMNPYSKPLDYAGTATTGLALLLPAILLTAPSKDYWKIGVEYAETFVLAYGVKELCKFCVNRARPYMYFCGAVIGTGIGILVPFLNSLWIKPSYKSKKVQVTGSPMGFVIQAKF